jgi:hypothetical protein
VTSKQAWRSISTPRWTATQWQTGIRATDLLKCQNPMEVFIKCRKCGQHNRVDGVPPNRVDLAILRGSEEPIKCRSCHSEMDTLTAFLGEQVGSEIMRREDPK